MYQFISVDFKLFSNMPTSSVNDRANDDHFEPISQVYGCAVIFVSALLFHTINRVIFRFVRCPVEEDESWKWRNLVVSWIHALIIGTWDLSWLVKKNRKVINLEGLCIWVGVSSGMRNTENWQRVKSGIFDTERS